MDLYTSFFGHSFFALLDDFFSVKCILFWARCFTWKNNHIWGEIWPKMKKSLVLRLPLKAHFFHVTADIVTYPKIRILVTRTATTK